MGSRSAFISSPLPGSDTACATPAACRLKTALANKCNYGREALQATYEGLNIAAHVMGVLISLLCGCTGVFVRGQAVCVLQNVPPVCVFPYNVYVKTFSGSTQLWEAVKGATKSCLVHGDAAVAS